MTFKDLKKQEELLQDMQQLMPLKAKKYDLDYQISKITGKEDSERTARGFIQKL